MKDLYKKDILNFLGLFFISIVIVYLLPAIVGNVWFLILLGIFAKSKLDRNYFWLMFFWFIFLAPGYLFYSKGIYHLPSISVPGMGREIFFKEMFAFVAILKVLYTSSKQKVFYQKAILILLSYSIVLLIIGTARGSSILTTFKSVRYFMPMVLLFTLPKLIPYHTVPRLFSLLFFSVFILVLAQLFDFIHGAPFATLLGENNISFAAEKVGNFEAFDVTKKAARIVYGPQILLLSLIISLALLTRKEQLFKPNYLYIISFLSVFSIFMSATRGWIIASVFIFLGFGMLNSKKAFRMLLIAFSSLLVALTIPKINLQFTHASERVLTLESLAEGDETAGGSLDRITKRGPRVMNKFAESPWWGFGFSNEYYEYSDGHVGNQTLLLNGGIIGFVIFLFVILFFIIIYFRAYIINNNRPLFIFLFGLGALVIIHSSSAMIFGYAIKVEGAIWLALFFFLSDYFKNINK